MFHNRLKNIRTACALTQKQVADALKIDRSTYTCYETGKSQPTIDSLTKLAALFNVTVDMLVIEGDDAMKEKSVLGDEFNEFDGDVTNMSFLNLEKDEKELIMYYRLLKDEDKNVAIKKINELYEENNN